MLKINGLNASEEIALAIISFALVYLAYSSFDMLWIAALGSILCATTWYKRRKYLKYRIRIFVETLSEEDRRQEQKWGFFTIPVIYAAGETLMVLFKQGLNSWIDIVSLAFLALVGAWSISEFLFRIRL